MPIKNICQPEFIHVDQDIRLRKYDGCIEFALKWYEDKETVWLVDGTDIPYHMDKLRRMYTYLDEHGELYFIEVLSEEGYRPIGDVTFWQMDMPIVIGDRELRGKGIGKKVVKALVERGRELGYKQLYVNEIYYGKIKKI